MLAWAAARATGGQRIPAGKDELHFRGRSEAFCSAFISPFPVAGENSTVEILEANRSRFCFHVQRGHGEPLIRSES